MIEVIEQTIHRAKLDHDLIVPITNPSCIIPIWRRLAIAANGGMSPLDVCRRLVHRQCMLEY